MSVLAIVGVSFLVLFVVFLLLVRFDTQDVGPDHPDFRR